MNSDDRKDSRSPQAKAGSRRPYQKPSFRHEKVFETMALGCGKIGGTGGPCNIVPKLS
jgi:hypothetical protein